ncbi:MAG: hypothetical protein KAS32_05755 [Candidatus Peribacteraceae bacterium]|nr:hypothetical protein [Candidatus Peribacteraceae bacterium]
MPNTDCPKCEGKNYTQARCPRRQRDCKDCGETWHFCTVHNTIVLGPSDKMLPITQCTCQLGGILRRNPLTGTIN